MAADLTSPTQAPARQTRDKRPWYRQLSWLILIAMGFGVIAGLIAHATDSADDLTLVTAPIGTVFIKLLRMIMMPLIFTSIVTGVTGVGDPRRLGRIGLKTVGYYLATTGLAVILGLFLVTVIRPGERDGLTRADMQALVQQPASATSDSGDGDAAEHPPAASEHSPDHKSAVQPKGLSEIFLGIVPHNVFDALATDDVLPVIFFALLLGLALAVSGEPARPVTAFFEGSFVVVMRITDWVMWTAPLGVAALIAGTVAVTGVEVLGSLAAYFATVMGGLAIHGLVTLPLLLLLLARTNPWRFAKAMFQALLTAFSTASSSATLPVSLECAEKNAGVSNRIASFVLPLGATVNMDGTALYEAIAALFIAQVYQIDLSFAQQVIIFLTATLAAIGAAGVPSAGLVTMVLVLRAVGLPEEGIALLLAVDRVLDMFRTTVNVWGDAVGARIVAGSEGEVSVVGESSARE